MNWKRRLERKSQRGLLKVRQFISRQLNVFVTTAACVIQKFKVHKTVGNLPECGG